MNEDKPLRIGFLGAGKMATALARGWIQSGLVGRDRVVASDPSAAARQEFQQVTGVGAIADNATVVGISGVLILAVKPQSMPALLAEIRSLVKPSHLIVSIAAGSSLRQLAETLGKEQRIVRVMPNTPCLVGAGASAFALGEHATTADGQLVQKLLDAVGRAVPVSEHLLDAVTGLSGSGPAFVYLVIEALSDGGVRMGLPRDVATTLAAQTVLGAARMVLETNEHPGLLKDRVASPAGTTIAGLHALERGGLRGALMDAVEAATLRAAELAKG
ncbi:MAG TPA: pyrroline-5-carboxylate reductase [Gemmataceae bacterium]|jgi:pyrroline-5-carboxylate reductase|nr:pyrroline-5-carboxylate reductase [Gemmataceae bacterium]